MENNWKEFITVKIKEIKATIGSEKAVVAVSGGVDSAVAAELAWLALPSSQITTFTIDDGLRREGEPDWVVKTFRTIGIPVQIISTQKKFFSSLRWAEDGEKRRKIYSHLFGQICGQVAHDFGSRYAFLGTNALDLVEVRHGGQKQHNAWQAMGIDPETRFGFTPIEPLKKLFKADIRELAQYLDLPPEIKERMPFPGPGLSIRLMEAVTLERVALIRQATEIVEKHLLPLKPFQCLAFLMANQATTRRAKGAFGKIIAVRCVDSHDSGQTATPTIIPQDVQQKVVEELMTLPWVARVVFDPTPKPPGRIEYI
jgi:GMP synthase (glutamine-hydrolysing)